MIKVHCSLTNSDIRIADNGSVKLSSLIRHACFVLAGYSCVITIIITAHGIKCLPRQRFHITLRHAEPTILIRAVFMLLVEL